MISILFLFFFQQSHGQQAQNRPQYLDFEAEVFEGEAMRPDLFLHISTPDISLDSVIFVRKDFLDFHRFDKNHKPKFVPEKR